MKFQYRFKNQLAASANKPLTATMPIDYIFVIHLTFAAFSGQRWLQYFIKADLENSKLVYTFVVL